MTRMNSKSKPVPKQKLGFLLTLTLIWLCLFTINQTASVAVGISVMTAAFLGEVPLLSGIAFLLTALALVAIGILTIVFLLRGNKLFYVMFPICTVLSSLMTFLSNPIDIAAILALIFVVLFEAAIWVLLFVSDTPRKRFGLPILHSRKKKSENT